MENLKKVFRRDIVVPIVNQKVVLIVCCNDIVDNYFKDIIDLDDYTDKDCDGFTILWDNIIYVYLDSDVASLSTLVHEVCHVVYRIMQTRNYDINDQEAFAYFYEYVFNELLLCLELDATDHIKIPSNPEDEQA